MPHQPTQPTLGLTGGVTPYARAQQVCAAAPALTDAYREWFMLAADHAAGRPIPTGAFAEALALLREAERQTPERDPVYAAAALCWRMETSLDPVLGTPL